MEIINNKIKILIFNSYVYRNFVHYKNRILLHFKFKPINENDKQLDTPKKGELLKYPLLQICWLKWKTADS